MSGMYRNRLKRNSFLSFQRVLQLTAAVLVNGYLAGFQKGRIYTGGSKALCVPVLNCYSCPGALGSCPIGALQTVLGGRHRRFPFYVCGMLMLFGVVLGRAVCGLLCPFGLVQDLLYQVRKPLAWLWHRCVGKNRKGASKEIENGKTESKEIEGRKTESRSVDSLEKKQQNWKQQERSQIKQGQQGQKQSKERPGKQSQQERGRRKVLWKKVDFYARYLKYGILLVLVLLLPAFAITKTGVRPPYFCQYLCPAGTLEGGIPGLLQNPGLRAAAGALWRWKLFVLLAVLAASVLLPRPFCRYLCPLGAFYSLFQRFSFFQMKLDSSKCVGCKACERACPMAVEVTKQINSPECIRCGACKAICPTGAVSSGFISKEKHSLD